MVEEDTEFTTFDGDVITKSEYRDEIINKYIQANIDGLTKITDFTIGSEAYHLADVMASLMLEHRELIDLNYRMSMIYTAEGEFLDNFGDPRGVHRIGASPSVGDVTFTRLSEETSEEIPIPDGLQVATADAITFLVDIGDEEISIPPGETQVTVEVICELEGSYTNVLPNTITMVMDGLASKVSVTNNAQLTGGTDIETDDEYRARILLSPYDVPCGSLAWYEHLSNELDSVHDTYVVKGETALDADVIINFNPTNRENIVPRGGNEANADTLTQDDWDNYNETNDIESISGQVMTVARQELIKLFGMKEYDIVGITRSYHLANQKIVLQDTSNVNYLFGVVLETNYTLNMVKNSIIEKIEAFNNDASIGVEFMPSSLAVIIENEIEGVNLCKIVSSDGTNYTELIEPISVDADEVFHIDMTNIEDKIQLLNFNVGIDVED